MNDVINKLARKLVLAEEKLMMQEHFPPLDEAPHSLTNRTDHLPYVLWVNDPYYEGDLFPWHCQGAFRWIDQAMLVIKDCQSRGVSVVLQSPYECNEITLCQ